MGLAGRELINYIGIAFVDCGLDIICVVLILKVVSQASLRKTSTLPHPHLLAFSHGRP